MSLVVLGVSHDTAPIQVREQLALAGEQSTAALNRARHRGAECVILSTCNRLEIYILQRGRQERRVVLGDILEESAAHLDYIEPHLYSYEGTEAASHLFRVASGMDSLILGEVQVLGQVHRAWQAAHKAGSAGPVLSQLFHKAVALGKRAHSETSISRNPASISYAAVVLAKQILGPELTARRVLVIGTGEVGEGVARCLYEHGLHATVIAHRQLERAQTVARRYDAEMALWEDLPEKLTRADIVISSTSAPHTILQRHQLEEAMSARENRPLYLIDLAVPRDIDPNAATLPGVHLHNIDHLQEVVQTTIQERKSALPAIEMMIDEEVAHFDDWLRVRSVVPTIMELQSQADEIARLELAWAMSKLPELTPRERQVIEAMATRIAGKLLHGPIQRLKTQARENIEPGYTIDALAPGELADLFYSGVEAEDVKKLHATESEE